MTDLLKTPTLAQNLIALRSKSLPEPQRKELATTVLEQMRDLVSEASDLIHELHLPDGLSNVLWQGIDCIDTHFGTVVGSLVETADRSLYTLDNLLWALGTSNSLWLRTRGTVYDRADERRKAAREQTPVFAGADAAKFGPAEYTIDCRRQPDDCGGDIESQYPDPTVRKVHACKCDCDPHVGPVQQVQVSSGMRDWGTYWYCQTAINEDRQRGLIVEVVEPATERQGGGTVSEATKHTPGPWRLECEPWDCDFSVDVSSDDGAYLAATSADEVSVEARNANGRLIAAAPELLEALVGILSSMAVLSPVYRNGAIGSADTAMARATAAIAKATGQGVGA